MTVSDVLALARKRRNTAATRRACFLGETLGHVLGSQLMRASRQRSISPNTMSSEPLKIAETSASMCSRLKKSRAAQRNGSYS